MTSANLLFVIAMQKALVILGKICNRKRLFVYFKIDIKAHVIRKTISLHIELAEVSCLHLLEDFANFILFDNSPHLKRSFPIEPSVVLAILNGRTISIILK